MIYDMYLNNIVNPWLRNDKIMDWHGYMQYIYYASFMITSILCPVCVQHIHGMKPQAIQIVSPLVPAWRECIFNGHQRQWECI